MERHGREPLPLRHERLAVERPEAVVEECRGIGKGLARLAEDDRDEPGAVAFRRGDDAIAGGLRVPGLDAERTLVEPQEHVAVLQVPWLAVRARDVRELRARDLREQRLFVRLPRELEEIARRGVTAVIEAVR